MSSRRDPSRSDSRAPVTPSTGTEHVSVVSEWRDAETFVEADLTGEVAGRKVVPLVGHDERAAEFEPGIARLLGFYPGNPGFLFNGDDGDSLWFWPEDEPVAFRFAPDAASKLRKVLAENVGRLVSQGALVFCYEERDAGSRDPVFHFPELVRRAA